MQNRVVITHLPSGLKTQAMERATYLNKRIAMHMMRSKLAAPASPFMIRDYVLNEPPERQIEEFDAKYSVR